MKRVNGTAFVVRQIVANGAGVIPGTDYVEGELFELAVWPEWSEFDGMLVVRAGEPDLARSQTPVTVISGRN